MLKLIYDPKPAAAGKRLAVPTPVTSAPTTPVLDTRFVSDEFVPAIP